MKSDYKWFWIVYIMKFICIIVVIELSLDLLDVKYILVIRLLFERVGLWYVGKRFFNFNFLVVYDIIDVRR